MAVFDYTECNVTMLDTIYTYPKGIRGNATKTPNYVACVRREHHPIQCRSEFVIPPVRRRGGGGGGRDGEVTHAAPKVSLWRRRTGEGEGVVAVVGGGSDSASERGLHRTIPSVIHYEAKIYPPGYGEEEKKDGHRRTRGGTGGICRGFAAEEEDHSIVDLCASDPEHYDLEEVNASRNLREEDREGRGARHGRFSSLHPSDDEDDDPSSLEGLGFSRRKASKCNAALEVGDQADNDSDDFGDFRRVSDADGDDDQRRNERDRYVINDDQRSQETEESPSASPQKLKYGTVASLFDIS
ncbi:hypothetical protein FGB62_397g01 [Gracilaria domingensis]|nr:hypothetical protein FGB62_397g01 [Gracilaria domingensis]